MIEEIEQHTLNQEVSNTELYRRFVNYWHSLGTEQSTQLLQKRLADLEPSTGYYGLRTLVETGFISTIITTNFDLLIDRAFAGLSYNLISAHHEVETIGPGHPCCLVMKVHGDLSRGGLRFSPHELNTLPPSISETIREETFWPTLVIGYRGQDLGLMSSLNREPAYNAFWATPHYPDHSDHYTNEPVFQWMNSRRSTSNFIYGDASGRFDALFEYLESELTGTNQTDRMVTPAVVIRDTPWAQSQLLQSASLIEDYGPFLKLLIITRDKYGASRWTPTPPHFARSYESLLEAYLQVIERDLLPKPLADQLDDMHLLSILLSALELLARSAGFPNRTALSLLDESLDELESLSTTPEAQQRSINELRHLLQALEEVHDGAVGSFFSSHIPTDSEAPKDRKELLETLLLVDALAACFPTAGPTDLFSGEAVGLKFTLQRAVEDLRVEGDRTCVSLAAASPESLVPVLTRFFEVLPEANLDLDLLTFHSRWLVCRISIVSTAQELADLPPALNLGELLQRECESSAKKFLTRPSPFVIAGNYVELAPEQELRRFLTSSTASCLVVGPSGSGKTTLLKAIVRSLAENPAKLVLARSASETGDFLSFEEIFFGRISLHDAPSSEDFLRHLWELLSARGMDLLLILDAINEAPGNLESRAALFGDALQLAAQLSAFGDQPRVRLILTLRESTFKQFLTQGLKPNTEDFFCPRIAAGDDRPYVDLQELNSADQAALIEEYFDDEAGPLFRQLISSNALLAHDFRHPYLIAIAGRCLRSRADVRKLGSAADVFADFSQQMLRRIGPEDEQAHAVSVVFGYLRSLLGTAGGSFRVVTKLALLLSFPAEDRKRAADFLVVLQDVNIFNVSTDASGDVLTFTHDRIAEFFFGEFLLANYDNEELVRRTLKVSHREPIARGGVTHLLLRTLSVSRDSPWPERRNLSILEPILRSLGDPEVAEFVTEAIARSLVLGDHPRTVLEVLWELLRELESPEALLGLPLSQAIGEGLGALLERYRLPRVADVTQEIIDFLRQRSPQDAGIPDLLSLQADAQIRAGRFSEALATLDAAGREMKYADREDDAFSDRLFLLRSVALREMGFKSEAIEHLRQVYVNQKQMSDWTRAAETGLELGAALRDDTRFSEAKNLYAEIEEHREGIRDATEVRLVLQLGTLYKNLTQERSNQRESGPSASMVEYKKACQYLDSAIRLAQRADSPVLLAEALADRAELGILAAEDSPEELGNAKAYLRRLEYVLAYFPIVARMVEFCRLRAKILVLEGEIEQAVKLIQQGRALATENEDSFRVADCDYQLSHLVLRNLSSVPTTEFLNMGVAAFGNAESYYVGNVSSDNIYLKRVRSGHRELLRRGAELGIIPES